MPSRAHTLPVAVAMSRGSARSSAFLALVVAAGTATVHLTGSPGTPAPVVRDLLDQYCVTCHNGRLKTAGLQLDALDPTHVADHAKEWEKVVSKLRTGEMPPPGRPRPDAATYKALATALEGELDA